MDFIGGEARGGANRVVIGVFDMGKMASQSLWCSLQTMASISAIVWLTCSTPPFPLG